MQQQACSMASGRQVDLRLCCCYCWRWHMHAVLLEKLAQCHPRVCMLLLLEEGSRVFRGAMGFLLPFCVCMDGTIRNDCQLWHSQGYAGHALAADSTGS
jgi:hypothetical protein